MTKTYKLSGFLLCAVAAGLIVLPAAWTFLANPSNVSDHTWDYIIADYLISGIIFWTGTTILLRRGIPRSGKSFLKIIAVALVYTGIFLSAGYTLLTCAAYSHYQF